MNHEDRCISLSSFSLIINLCIYLCNSLSVHLWSQGLYRKATTDSLSFLVTSSSDNTFYGQDHAHSAFCDFGMYLLERTDLFPSNVH